MKLTDMVKLTPPVNNKWEKRPYWTASIGRVEAQAPEKDAAVEALRTTIKTTFAGEYLPYFLPFRGWLGVAWRTAQGWAYHFYSPEELGQQEATLFKLRSCNYFDSQEECLKHLRSHLAGVAWDQSEETSPIILDSEGQDQFGRMSRWQKRYKELKQTGMEDNDIREQLRLERL